MSKFTINKYFNKAKIICQLKRIFVLIIICFAVFDCYALAPQEEYNDLINEKIKLVEQVNNLNGRIKELNSTIDGLQSKIVYLSGEVRKLRDENRELTEENDSFSSQDETSYNSSSSYNSDLYSTYNSDSSDSSYNSDTSSSFSITNYAYIGNKNSHKFHRPSCSTLPDESNRIYYSSRSQAISDGMAPCKRCNP